MNPIKKDKFSIVFNQDGYLELVDFIKNNDFYWFELGMSMGAVYMDG